MLYHAPPVQVPQPVWAPPSTTTTIVQEPIERTQQHARLIRSLDARPVVVPPLQRAPDSTNQFVDFPTLHPSTWIAIRRLDAPRVRVPAPIDIEAPSSPYIPALVLDMATWTAIRRSDAPRVQVPQPLWQPSAVILIPQVFPLTTENWTAIRTWDRAPVKPPQPLWGPIAGADATLSAPSLPFNFTPQFNEVIASRQAPYTIIYLIGDGGVMAQPSTPPAYNAVWPLPEATRLALRSWDRLQVRPVQPTTLPTDVQLFTAVPLVHPATWQAIRSQDRWQVRPPQPQTFPISTGSIPPAIYALPTSVWTALRTWDEKFRYLANLLEVVEEGAPIPPVVPKGGGWVIRRRRR